MKNPAQLPCGHWACHGVTVYYFCTVNCGSVHSAFWCELCESEGKPVRPWQFKTEVERRKHLNSHEKPDDYNRQLRLDLTKNEAHRQGISPGGNLDR